MIFFFFFSGFPITTLYCGPWFVLFPYASLRLPCEVTHDQNAKIPSIYFVTSFCLVCKTPNLYILQVPLYHLFPAFSLILLWHSLLYLTWYIYSSQLQEQQLFVKSIHPLTLQTVTEPWPPIISVSIPFCSAWLAASCNTREVWQHLLHFPPI
jgi:hypothetical protein